GGIALHRVDDDLDVLVEVDAQLLGAGEDLLAVDASGEGFVLEFFLDGLDVDVGDGLAGPHQRDRRHEADQLVDGVEHLLHRRRPGWLARSSSLTGHFGLLTHRGGPPTLISGGLVHMVRHLHHWLDMVEALLIIGILLAIGWVTWLALTQAYSPVFNLFNKL